MFRTTVGSQILLLALFLPLLSSLPGSAQDDFRPGETDPLQNPARLTLFSDDEVFLPASANIASYFYEVELEAQDGNLSNWQSTETQNTTTYCNYPSRRVARGRIAVPTHDQILCATNYRLDLLGAEPKTLQLPGAGLVRAGRPVSIAVGDMDRVADDDGILHPEIAVSYAEISGQVSTLILGHNLNILGTYTLPDAVLGDVALAAGDFDGDGVVELVVAMGNAPADAYDPGNFGQRQGELFLQTLDVIFPEGAGPPDLVPGMSEPLRLEATGAYFSTTLVAGDFDGDAIDEIALGYYNLASGSPFRVEIYETQNGLVLAKKSEKTLGQPALTSYTGLAAGTMKHAPPEYSVDRRQLAAVHAETGGQVKVHTLDPSTDLTTIATTSLNLNATSAVENVGPGISVGNYVGLSNTEAPVSQIVVQVPETLGSTRTYPRFFSIQPDENLQMTVTQGIDYPHLENSGGLWSQELQAYDRDGDSLYLGAPIHITVSDLVDPYYIILEPPKHVDYLPVDPSQPDGPRDIRNISGFSTFYVTLSNETQQTLQTSTTDTTSWNIGGSAGLTSKSTIGGGFGDIASASVTNDLKTAVSYDYNEITSETNSEYRSLTVSEEETTSTDDQLRARIRLLDIWRYPCYGLVLTDPPEFQGFYELILPGPTVIRAGGGLDMEWYNPTHQNRNILSYPKIGSPDFPPDLGSFTPEGAEEPVTTPLNEAVTRFWNGNAQVFSLTWTEESGSESSKETSSTLKENVDMSIGISSSVDFIIKAENETTFDFNFQNSNSWSNNTISKETMASTTGIKLNKPGGLGSSNEAYGFETLAYYSTAGYLKVNHAVDALASATGQKFWKDYYGQRPDPAVNLPNRFVNVGGDWILTPGGGGQQVRTLALRKGEVNPVTGTHDFYGDALTAVSDVEITCNIYNFSVSQATPIFDVLFQYEEINPISDQPIGPRVDIGRIPVGLQPLQIQPVVIPWDVSNLAGTQPGFAKYYRLHVVVDPDDQVPAEIHDGLEAGANGEAISNNVGYWPWTGGVPIFYSDGSRTASRSVPADVSLASDALEIFAAGNGNALRLADIQPDQPYRLRVRLHSSGEERRYRHVLIHDGDPQTGGRLIAHKIARGLVPGDNYIWVDWWPQEPPVGAIHVEVLEALDDPSRGNATSRLSRTP